MQKVQHVTDKEFNILKYFYSYRAGYVRQIKKSVRLSEHTLLKYLSRLDAKGILLPRREGNLKIFEVCYKNPFVKVFFAYFDVLRLSSVEYKRKRAIEEFVIGVKKVKIPYFILLFGSTAKGVYAKKSDIDLIVVYDHYTTNTKNQLESLAKNIFAETGLKVNFILMTLEEFIKERESKENYALQDALQTGYPVFGNTLFYEVMF